MSTMPIGPNSRVTLHFALNFQDGGVIDSNFDGEAAVLVFGDGSLPYEFEQKLVGMTAGENGTFTLPPEQAFGQANPNNVQLFSRSDFAAELKLVEGLVISFADARQSELPGVVKSVQDDQVTVDFNHPLAGATILFKVSILAVDTADAVNIVDTEHE